MIVTIPVEGGCLCFTAEAFARVKIAAYLEAMQCV